MSTELSADTLEALQQQGGADGADTKDDKSSDTKEDLIDINIIDQDDKKDKSDSDDPPAELDGDDDKSGSDDKDDKGDDDSDLNKGVAKSLSEAGYTDEQLIARLNKDDGISDEFVKELKEKLDPAFVDAHVGRLRAEYDLAKVKESGKLEEAQKKFKEVQDMNTYIYDSVGGKDKFDILGSTLKAELSKNELAALNVKLASGNKDVVKEAMQGAVKKYNDIRGMGGKLMEGDAGQGTEPAVHITKEEYRMLMRTDKYKTDPKYRDKVDEDRLKTRVEDSKKYGAGQYYGYHAKKGRYSL